MKKLLQKISARTYISMGLVSLTTSLLFLSFFFGMVPDEDKAARHGRAALAESIAAFSTTLISKEQDEQLQATLGFILERNPDLRSAAIRTEDGKILASWGDHIAEWGETAGKHSNDAHIVVPIFSGELPWGSVELAFKPLKPPGLIGLLHDPRVQLVLFISIAGFVLFYFYLGRMLKHLDPSRAVPERVRSALDTLTEGLLVVDTKGQIVLANQAFAEFLGRESSKLTGISVNSLAWQDAQHNKPKTGSYPWEQALRSGAPTRNNMLWLADQSGKRRTFMANSSPILVGKGVYGGVMVSLDDVTELEEKEIELRLSKKEADTANQAKSEFLANMSHEIRSPLNAVLGFTELLRRGQVKNETDYRRFLDIVHASGSHLLGLINDILDLSKVEAGHLEVEHIACSPYQIANEVVQALNVKALEKNILITLECPGAIPDSMMSDPSRLRQILTNLVGNAVKFTDKGGVTVTLRFQPTRPVSQLVFEVRDSGIGISPASLGNVFEPFVQAESNITRRFGGTGLGLAISRRFARLMNGDIVATSTPGEGSLFTLTLPAGPIEQVKLVTPEDFIHQISPDHDTPSWDLSKVHVLIVDDGEENRELVRLVLEEAGALTDQAENGQVALDKTQRHPYDLVLMDLQMPVMDGETAILKMRDQGLTTPVVALTAHAMKGFEEHILSTGFTAYLSKPINIDELMNTVARLTHSDQVPARLKKSEVRPLITYKANSVARVPVISRLSGNARLRPAIEKFVVRLDGQVTAMETAWRTQDVQALSDLAHWLKGAGGTVGFDAFNEPSKKLESLLKAGTKEGVNEVIGDIRDLAARIELPEIHAPAGSTQERT